ncbi:MAG: hypothetical protein AAGB30_10835 [Pedobacter sp.]|nr:hypothetical protein [Pedobacter sp.]
MKTLQYFSLLFLFVASLSAKAQSYQKTDYAVETLHELCDEITLDNHKVIAAQRGFKFVKNDPTIGAYIYKKNDNISLYVQFKQGKLATVSFVLTPETLAKMLDEEGKNIDNYTYMEQKENGNDLVLVGLYKGHALAINTQLNRVSMMPKMHDPIKGAAPIQPPSPAVTEKQAEEDVYFSAKEVADAINQNFIGASLVGRVNFRFDVRGKIDFNKRSIRMISKGNVLYIQMNIPRNGSCDYGLKEVKAVWRDGIIRHGSSYYDFVLEYKFECNGVKYDGVGLYFKSDQMEKGLETWMKKNIYIQ